jgi:hypothetical protein
MRSSAVRLMGAFRGVRRSIGVVVGLESGPSVDVRRGVDI